jgi:alpha-L-fucosidase 2
LVNRRWAGGLTTCPSISPEDRFLAPNGQIENVSAGTTMDIALIREIFGNSTAAGKLLELDPEFCEGMATLTPRLPPYKIGRFGQLQEWSIDFEEKFPSMRLFASIPGLSGSADCISGHPRASCRGPQVAGARA